MLRHKDRSEVENGVYCHNNGKDAHGMNVDVFDANGNQLTGSKYDFMASVDSLEADVSSWKNGTYYLKLSTASSKAVSGSIEIDCD